MKKIVYTAALAMAGGIYAGPALATCGVGGYWGSECGPQTPVTGGDTTNTATGGASSSDATAGANSGATADAIIGDVTGGGAEIGDITAIGGDGGQGGAGGSSTSGVIGSGNSDSRSSVTGSGNSNSRSQTTTTVDASSRTTYREAANSIILPPVIPNQNDECGIGVSLGGSSTQRTFGGGLSVRDKSCAVVKQMERERHFMCSAFGTQSPECASAVYHASALGAMAMVESGRVREKSGHRQGIAPAKMKSGGANIVNTWTRGEKARASVAEPAAQTVRCPEGSVWDGNGCWARNLSAVRR